MSQGITYICSFKYYNELKYGKSFQFLIILKIAQTLDYRQTESRLVCEFCGRPQMILLHSIYQWYKKFLFPFNKMKIEKTGNAIENGNKRGKGTFRHQIISALRRFGTKAFFSVLSHSKTGQGITMAETLIIILAEHNVPINFADHFSKLVSNKLVFPDSVFLRVLAACLLAKRSHRVRCHYFFSRNLTGLLFYLRGTQCSFNLAIRIALNIYMSISGLSHS